MAEVAVGEGLFSSRNILSKVAWYFYGGKSRPAERVIRLQGGNRLVSILPPWWQDINLSCAFLVGSGYPNPVPQMAHWWADFGPFVGIILPFPLALYLPPVP